MPKNPEKCPIYLGSPGLLDPGIGTPGTQTPESRGCCPPYKGQLLPRVGKGAAQADKRRPRPRNPSMGRPAASGRGVAAPRPCDLRAPTNIFSWPKIGIQSLQPGAIRTTFSAVIGWRFGPVFKAFLRARISAPLVLASTGFWVMRLISSKNMAISFTWTSNYL
jgi:hypothetical protein